MSRNKKQCEELCPRIFQMLTKQGATHKKSRRTISIGNARKTMAGNQHQYY